jgi:hypothetical protein
VGEDLHKIIQKGGLPQKKYASHTFGEENLEVDCPAASKKKAKKGLSIMKKILVIIIVILVLVLGIGITIAVITNNTKTPTELDKSIDDSLENIFIEQPAVILPDPTVIVNAVQKLARLETYMVTYQRVFTYAVDQEYLFGACGKKMVFVASGQVIAGIDLGQLQEGDVEVVDIDTVKIKLPESQIFTVALNNNDSQVVTVQYGIFASMDPQLETIVRQYAQDDFEVTAKTSDVLTVAKLNGESFITDFLKRFGFTDIQFVEPDSIVTPST